MTKAPKKLKPGSIDGRPPCFKNEMDEQKLRAFMRMKPTLADTASFFQCSQRTVEKYIRDNFNNTFIEFRAQNMVHTRHSLIRKAIQMAEAGNVPMLIFSLKNLCNWSDKQDPTNLDDDFVFTEE